MRSGGTREAPRTSTAVTAKRGEVSAQWPPRTRPAATRTVSVVAPSTHRQRTRRAGRRRRTRPTRWPATAAEC